MYRTLIDSYKLQKILDIRRVTSVSKQSGLIGKSKLSAPNGSRNRLIASALAAPAIAVTCEIGPGSTGYDIYGTTTDNMIAKSEFCCQPTPMLTAKTTSKTRSRTSTSRP